MGLCNGKPIPNADSQEPTTPLAGSEEPLPIPGTTRRPKFSFDSPRPLPGSYKDSPANSSVLLTPLRFFKRRFPPPSPAKHIKALLVRWHGSVKVNEASIPEGSEVELRLDKNFGFSKHFFDKYERGDEVGRGHYGYTCSAKAKKGDLKGEEVAIKVIPKAKMTTAIAIEDVRREVRILSSLTGHQNLVQFFDAYEDDGNVYIVMELCKGGELLDRIFSRGGKYSEEDAKVVMVQILSIAAFCHLQGVVHRDLRPENFKTALMKNSTNAMKDSRVTDFVNMVSSFQYRKIDFEEFAAAAIGVHQLEGLGTWEQHAGSGYEFFEKDGNRPIMIEELASELGLGETVPVHVVLRDWIRHSDGKLSFLGFVKLLHGVSSRSIAKV